MNKAQLKKIESLRRKKELQALKDAEAAKKKAEAHDRFHNRELTEYELDILSRVPDSAQIDNAIERFNWNNGNYIPRVLTTLAYQRGLLSRGLAGFGVHCTSAYKGMGVHRSICHTQLSSKVAKLVKTLVNT